MTRSVPFPARRRRVSGDMVVPLPRSQALQSRPTSSGTEQSLNGLRRGSRSPSVRSMNSSTPSKETPPREVDDMSWENVKGHTDDEYDGTFELRPFPFI